MISRCLIHKPEHGHWLQLTSPDETLRATTVADVVPVLKAVEDAVARGMTAAGFLSYEAAPAFDSALQTHPHGNLPLAEFALFQDVEQLTWKQIPWQTGDQSVDWRLKGSKSEYLQNIARIRSEIGSGNVYQINYTLPLIASPVNAWSLFSQIARDALYAAFIEADDYSLVSASPELFFTLNDQMLRCEPMKGTASRGLSAQADRDQARWLASSAKNRAENLMITDMVRNDLGRFAQSGSVVTSDMFKITRHPTVWQMTSAVHSRTNASISEILSHLFPGASITGAPKNASMALIRELEDTPRGIYTGAIGVIEPNRQAQFSIAIRTASVQHPSGTASYHAGGGIVWDSQADEEFEELLAKTRILKHRAEDKRFSLLETLRWEPDSGYHLLAAHLERLSASAEYFDIECCPKAIEQQLQGYAELLPLEPQRVRLLLDSSGCARIEHQPLPEPPEHPVPLSIYPEAIDPQDVLLYHKTTERGIYDRAVAWAPAGSEALLHTPDGYLTESAIANLVYQIDGKLYTPPVSCGLLPGTLRQSLLKKGEITERPLEIAELASCDALWLINSLRGWRRAVFHPD